MRAGDSSPNDPAAHGAVTGAASDDHLAVDHHALDSPGTALDAVQRRPGAAEVENRDPGVGPVRAASPALRSPSSAPVCPGPQLSAARGDEGGSSGAGGVRVPGLEPFGRDARSA